MIELTPLDAQTVLSSVRRYFLDRHFKVAMDEAAFPDAPYRTSLTCRRRDELQLVECQSRLDYHRALKSFHQYLVERRLPAELYVAVAESDEENISVARLREMDRDGVGLLLLDERSQVSVNKKACNWAYFAAPDPTLKFGALRPQVDGVFLKYNREDRVSGMRELSNLVEGETRRLGRTALARGRFGSRTPRVDAMDWSDVINLLASRQAASPGSVPVINDELKNDLHSFRGGRNLVDHPVRDAAEARRVARQFQDRMLLGARLVSDLDARRRSITRRMAGR